jgi:glucose/arabinose dehydrogenase
MKNLSARSRVRAESLEDRTLFATVPAGFQYADYVTGLPECTSMTFAPDGRIFYAEKGGTVRVVKNGQVLSTPLVKVNVDEYFERGLENITLDPSFASNGVFYLYYTKPDPNNPNTAPNNAKNRISRFRVNPSNPDVVDPATPEAVVVDNIPSDSGYHNGGAMVFGGDGYMYVGCGEVGLPSLQVATTRAQDLSTLAGKILRINPRAGAQLIPSDNPFVGQTGKRGEIYGYGVRNPFTGNVKPGTNIVYFNDVGSSIAEEIDQAAKGANYGFPASEGYTTNSAYTNPVYAYTHASTGNTNGQAAITGGTFYTGTKFPAQYQGKYFFADYVNHFIKVFDPAVPRQATGFATNTNSLIDLDMGPDGNLYALKHTVGNLNGTIVKISYVGSANRNPDAVANADKTSGPLPLTVNFDGNGTTDPDGDTLTYSWNFGDGATGTGKTTSHAYTTKGNYNAVLTVSDGKGGIDAAPAITIYAGDNAPNVQITSPANNSFYQGGQLITYSGTAIDTEDGTLDASKFTWNIILHHEEHEHPFLTNITGVKSGSFTIPVDLEVDPVQYFRILLTVTDSNGASTTSEVDIKPQTSTFTLASNIAGIKLNLDGVAQTAGTSTTGVVGSRRNISAPSSQVVNGTAYEFVSWSDGGAIAHDIFTPSANTTYTATYKLATLSTATVRASADAYVRDGTYASTNFGTATALAVKKSANAGNSRETYLKFDISQFNNIGAATLRIFGADSVSTQNVPVALYGSSNAWTETGITNNNKPVAGGTPLGTATVAGTIGTWYQFDVSTYVQNQRAANATAVTFAIKATATTDAIATFNSDENGASQPQLVVKYVPTQPPPPGNPITINTTAATYVRDGTYADQNFGSSTELQLKKAAAGSGSNREIWFKFDLSTAATISAAKLRVWGRIDSTTETAAVSAYSSTNTGWSESTLTWNNRPAAGTTALSSVTVATSTQKWYELDVTNFLKSEKALGHNLVTLVLRTSTSTTPYLIFSSDEAGSNTPQLQITP